MKFLPHNFISHINCLPEDNFKINIHSLACLAYNSLVNHPKQFDDFLLMCGISGVIDLKSHTTEPKIYDWLVQKMLDKMRHRGPDEVKIVSGNGYSLGTARLKILGDEHGQQPFQNKNSALAFNGEIYNYRDLAKNYLGNITNTHSDSNILFQFLNKYSFSNIDALNGMFSFCYIDKNYIYLARDRFGKKPLYYTCKNNRLFFASEIKAFIELVDFEIKLPKFYPFLETALMGETIFKDIFEIKPSTYLKINRKNFNITTHQYYSIFDIKGEKGSESYLKEKLRWLIEDSIKIRSDTDLPFGVFISGGVDSSIIALLTKPKFLLTYLPQTNLVNQEEKYADKVASMLPKSEYLKVKPAKENFLEELIQVVYFNGGPTTTLAAHSQYRLSKTLNNKQIRLAFSGLGIDEFFNGYVRHALSLIPKKYFDNIAFQGYEALINRINTNAPSLTYASLLNRSSRIDKEFINLAVSIFNKTDSTSAAISLCDALFTLPPLLHTDDHLNMAFGIESRAPFLDYRLVNFALGLSEEMKIKIDSKGEIHLKYLLKEAFKDILPKEIYLRNDKIGFSSNINDLLRSKLAYIVDNSRNLLNKYLPKIGLLWNDKIVPHPYIRWEYQVVQLAITYLLYCGKHSQKDVELILNKGALS